MRGKKVGSFSINVNDIIGKRFGKLEVISYAHFRYDETNGGKRVRHYYICRCDCGMEKLVQRDPLVCGIVHSCGCSRNWERDGERRRANTPPW